MTRCRRRPVQQVADDRLEVSGGTNEGAPRVSSSSTDDGHVAGRDRPRAVAASTSPIATRLVVANTAVGRGSNVVGSYIAAA
jgi:hypothetical protein